jgi:hypothetical protein
MNLVQSECQKYNSTSGCSIKAWGSNLWSSLFISILGGYPFKIDPSNQEHLETKKYFRQLFESLGYTLPCIYCRNSYKGFFKEINIDNFLSGRIELMYWLYLVKDKVNTKLIKQETDSYNEEKKKYKELYKSGSISEDQYYQHINEFKQKHVYTKVSPPFKEILEKYEACRSKCNKTLNKCN